MTKRRAEKPIALKALAARRSTALTELISDLEGKSRPRSQRALWTQEFLASGKIGKAAN